jgi:hypothetical protein
VHKADSRAVKKRKTQLAAIKRLKVLPHRQTVGLLRLLAVSLLRPRS